MVDFESWASVIDLKHGLRMHLAMHRRFLRDTHYVHEEVFSDSDFVIGRFVMMIK